MVSSELRRPVHPRGVPNTLSTRSTYARGASSASHSPSSFEAAYVLCGPGLTSSVYGSLAVPSKTKSEP
jgi:quercetin dioxygenase-like cupin family protein